MERRALLPLLMTAVLPAATDPVVEREILAAMEAWKQALLQKDAAAMDKLLHEDLIYIHSNGRNETKAEVLAALPRANTSYINFLETMVRDYGDVAFVNNKIDIRGGASTRPFLVGIVHVWLKDGQSWKMVSRQATRLTQ